MNKPKKLAQALPKDIQSNKKDIFVRLRTALVNLVHTEEVRVMLDTLKAKDPENGKVIEDNLLSIIDSCSKKASDFLAVTKLNSGVKKEERLLHEVLVAQDLRDNVEQAAQIIRARMTPYLSYSETMARRKADLQGFAHEAEQKFIDDLMDEIGDYMDNKRKILSDRIENETTTTARLADTFIKPAAKGAKWISEKAGMTEKDSSWDKLLVERLLEEELGSEILKRDISKIVEKKKQEFESSWQKKIAQNPPDVETIKLLAGSTGKHGHTDIGIHLEISTNVLTGGISAALAATFGLAAGWHTLEYALLEVFPPAAIIVVLLTAVTFAFTGKTARESRKQQIEKVIKQYYAMLIISLFKQPLKEFNNQTLPQVLHQKTTECVDTVLEHWEKQISGELTVEDYRGLTNVVIQFLAKLDKAAELLKEVIVFTKKVPIR